MLYWLTRATRLARPVLQFYDVTFGIRDIDELDLAGAGDFHDDKITDGSAACRDYRIPGSSDIIDLESYVREAGAIEGGCLWLSLGVVLEYLHRGTFVSIVRKSQVDPADLGMGNRGGIFQPSARKLSLWRRGRASEDSFVETGEFPPVPRDNVYVDESGVDGHTSPRRTWNISYAVIEAGVSITASFFVNDPADLRPV